MLKDSPELRSKSPSFRTVRRMRNSIFKSDPRPPHLWVTGAVKAQTANLKKLRERERSW